MRIVRKDIVFPVHGPGSRSPAVTSPFLFLSLPHVASVNFTALHLTYFRRTFDAAAALYVLV